MLMPDNEGMFVCKKDNFITDNLFEYMNHFGVEYDWMVRLNPKFSLNLFDFLSEMSNFIDKGMFDEAWEHLQSVVLLLINASGEDFEEFVEEAQVISSSQDMFDQIERFLDDDGTK